MPSTRPTLQLLRHALALGIVCAFAALTACGGSGSGSDGLATTGSGSTQKSDTDNASAASKAANDNADVHFAP